MYNYNNTYYEQRNAGGVRCPKCGSGGCVPINETDTQYKGFGVCKGLCGYLIMGPIGILCGLCGTGGKTKTRTFWVCPNCGKKFLL